MSFITGNYIHFDDSTIEHLKRIKVLKVLIAEVQAENEKLRSLLDEPINKIEHEKSGV